ncbi:MAG TPA: type VI secretion system tip protein VgrG [Fluviicola sp.]|nr:type VI secretion system tip protein VgrG [Fluviicola sp.]
MGVVTASILQNGKLIKPEFELLSIDIMRECNRIPVAELVYADGRPEKKEFPLSDSNFFQAGKEIEIRLRYEGKAEKEKTVFKGVVLGQSLRMSTDACLLQVELSDTAVRMTGSRKSNIFEEMKDTDVIGKLITTAGLTKEAVDATKVTHKRLVQYHASDWDFLLCRAEANGLLVMCNDGKLAVKAPDLSKSAVKTFKFGIDEIYHFEIESDTRNQRTAIKSAAYDIKTQKLTDPVSAKAFKLDQSGLNNSMVNKPMGNAEEMLIGGAALNTGEAQAWADATMLKNRLSILKGSMRIPGTGDFLVGDVIELEGMSKLFSGKTIITGIRHQVNTTEGWFTEIQFGITAERFTNLYPVNETPAAGLLPGVNGLQIGIVEKFEEDPEKEFRVKVRIPAIESKTNAVWARLGSLDAGKEHGAFFFPETGDEVILGFFNDDPRQPVILGSLYSSVNAPMIKPADKNPLKGFTSKKGLKITFDDEKKIMTLLTPGKQSIVIDDDKKTMELTDANKNKILLSKDGVQIDSAKDFILNASKGDVKITSGKKVEISAKQVEVI